mgnify:CR=1 FL=1|jgi:hypothetical protein
MYTYKTKNAAFICNSDFSGSVKIVGNNSTCGINEDGKFEIEISDLLDFVADAVRDKRISDIENMNTKDVLGL